MPKPMASPRVLGGPLVLFPTVFENYNENNEAMLGDAENAARPELRGSAAAKSW